MKLQYKYNGTLEDFENKLNEFIEKNKNGGYDFKIDSSGHLGSYWYITKMSEQNGNIFFTGKIIYKNGYSNSSKFEKIYNFIFEILISILLYPLMILKNISILIFKNIKKIIYIIRKKKYIELKEKKDTNENKLNNLMINNLNCECVYHY